MLQWLKEQQFLLNFVRRWPHSGQPEQLALLAPLLGGALGGEYNHPVKFALFNISRLSYKMQLFSCFLKLRIFGSNSDNNLEAAAAGHPPQEENNRQQQLVNRRHRRQRQAVVAAAGPVNRGHNNNNVALALHPRNNNQQEPPQAPERQQRRRWMANGQHSTWFQGQLSLLLANKSGAILFPFAGFCLKLKRHLLYIILSLVFSLLFHVPCRLDVISHRYSLHGPLARIVLFGRPVFSQGSVQNGQDISGVFARMLPPHLFVRPLSGPFGQSRRTHFQGEFHSLHIFILLNFFLLNFSGCLAVVPGKSRTSLSLQFCVSRLQIHKSESRLHKDK